MLSCFFQKYLNMSVSVLIHMLMKEVINALTVMTPSHVPAAFWNVHLALVQSSTYPGTFSKEQKSLRPEKVMYSRNNTGARTCFANHSCSQNFQWHNNATVHGPNGLNIINDKLKKSFRYWKSIRRAFMPNNALCWTKSISAKNWIKWEHQLCCISNNISWPKGEAFCVIVCQRVVIIATFLHFIRKPFRLRWMLLEAIQSKAGAEFSIRNLVLGR